MENNSDEIDIIELFRKFFTFIRNNKWILIVVFFLGLALGYYKAKQQSHPSNAYYRTQFIVKSDFLDDDEIYMESRDLAFTVIEDVEEKRGVLDKINRLEIIINKIEGKENEINLVFETKESVATDILRTLIIDKLKSNPFFQESYSLASKYYQRQKAVLNSLKTDEETMVYSNSKEALDYVKLLEKEQELEVKMLKINYPIQCLPIAPTNKLYPAPEFSIVLILSYGIILTIFIGFVILGMRFIKRTLGMRTK